MGEDIFGFKCQCSSPGRILEVGARIYDLFCIWQRGLDCLGSRGIFPSEAGISDFEVQVFLPHFLVEVYELKLMTLALWRGRTVLAHMLYSCLP